MFKEKLFRYSKFLFTLLEKEMTERLLSFAIFALHNKGTTLATSHGLLLLTLPKYSPEGQTKSCIGFLDILKIRTLLRGCFLSYRGAHKKLILVREEKCKRPIMLLFNLFTISSIVVIKKSAKIE